MRVKCIKTLKLKKRKGLMFNAGEDYEFSLEIIEKKTLLRGVKISLQAGVIVKDQLVLIPMKMKDFYVDFAKHFAIDHEWELDKVRFKEKLESTNGN